jgi:hypothetical protein
MKSVLRTSREENGMRSEGRRLKRSKLAVNCGMELKGRRSSTIEAGIRRCSELLFRSLCNAAEVRN